MNIKRVYRIGGEHVTFRSEQEPDSSMTAEEFLRWVALVTADYKKGLQRFLTLSDDMKKISGDIDDQLKAWKAEIESLEQEIAVVKDGDDSWNGVLRRRREWWQLMKDKLKYIPTKEARVGHRTYSTGVHLSVSALRELFHQIDCHLTLWWEKASNNRYRIARGRLKAGSREEDLNAKRLNRDSLPNLPNGECSASAHFDNPASLMVWCGLRNGRVVSSPSPAGRRPTAE